MSDFQIIYAIGLAVAIWWGGPDWRLSLACVLNFIGTMALAASPISVGVLDLVTVAALVVVGSWRGYALAAIFAFLVPIYPIGVHFEWPSYATYAIVDLFGVALLGVLASGDGGYRAKRRNKSRANGRGRAGVSAVVASWRDALGHHSQSSKMHKRQVIDGTLQLNESESRSA